jgi:hypothetical protein
MFNICNLKRSLCKVTFTGTTSNRETDRQPQEAEEEWMNDIWHQHHPTQGQQIILNNNQVPNEWELLEGLLMGFFAGLLVLALWSLYEDKPARDRRYYLVGCIFGLLLNCLFSWIVFFLK